jgi:hypothetical protein
MGGLSNSQGMSDEARVFLEEQDAENRKALREAGVDVEGLTPQQYNQAMIEMGEWLKLPENRAYRNQRSAIGKFVDSVGGPFGLFALTAGPLVAFGGGFGAAGGAAGGATGAGTAGAGAAAGSTGLGATLSSAAGKVGSVISSAAGALGGGGSMSGLGTLLLNAGTQIVGGLIQQKAAEKAIKNQRQMLTQADAAQAEAARKALEEVRAANLQAEELLAPYMELAPQQIQNLNLYQTAGSQALQEQSALAGLQGPEAQRAAIANLEANPEFQAIARQGEEAILANAAATGNLRGGNVQAALAQFRPELLQAYIDQQYSRLGGLSTQGLGVSKDLLARGFGAIGDVANLRRGTGTTAANLALGRGQDLSETLSGLGGLQASREAAQTTLPSSILKGANTILGDIFARQPGVQTVANLPGVATTPYNPAAINIGAGGGMAPGNVFAAAPPAINIGAGGGMAPGNVFAPLPPSVNINAGLQTPII